MDRLLDALIIAGRNQRNAVLDEIELAFGLDEEEFAVGRIGPLDKTLPRVLETGRETVRVQDNHRRQEREGQSACREGEFAMQHRDRRQTQQGRPKENGDVVPEANEHKAEKQSPGKAAGAVGNVAAPDARSPLTAGEDGAAQAQGAARRKAIRKQKNKRGPQRFSDANRGAADKNHVPQRARQEYLDRRQDGRRGQKTRQCSGGDR